MTKIDRETADYLFREDEAVSRYYRLENLLILHLEQMGDRVGRLLFDEFRDAAEERFGFEGDFRIAEIAKRLPEHAQDIERLSDVLSLTGLYPEPTSEREAG